MTDKDLQSQIDTLANQARAEDNHAVAGVLLILSGAIALGVAQDLAEACRRFVMSAKLGSWMEQRDPTVLAVPPTIIERLERLERITERMSPKVL